MAAFVFADDYRLGQKSTRKFYEHFMKGFVHKHNNYMGVIQGFSSLILYDDSINGEVRENAEQMQTSSKSASELNREILSTAGCARCELGVVNLSDVLTYWKSKIEEICGHSRVKVAINTKENIPALSADSTRLGELLFHLVRNAAESAADFSLGSVAIDFFAPGEASPGSNVDIFVRNTSASFDTEGLKRCFLPFETSKGSDHFGIGLTTAAVLAGDMGMRLGLRHADGTMTAWLAIHVAG
jgi:C4-dicarboxylate-specific signal transduction histidine kinase